MCIYNYIHIISLIIHTHIIYIYGWNRVDGSVWNFHLGTPNNLSYS